MVFWRSHIRRVCASVAAVGCIALLQANAVAADDTATTVFLSASEINQLTAQPQHFALTDIATHETGSFDVLADHMLATSWPAMLSGDSAIVERPDYASLCVLDKASPERACFAVLRSHDPKACTYYLYSTGPAKYARRHACLLRVTP